MNINQIKNTFNKFQQIISDLSKCPTLLFQQSDVNMALQEFASIAKDIEKEFPYYSNQINTLKNILFDCVYGGYNANPFVFGRMLEILAAIMNIAALDHWNIIHPRISAVSKSLYLNGHYAEASLKAFVAINQRMKEIHKIQCLRKKSLTELH